MPRPWIAPPKGAPPAGTPTSQSDAAINAARVRCGAHGTLFHPMTRCPDCKREAAGELVGDIGRIERLDFECRRCEDAAAFRVTVANAAGGQRSLYYCAAHLPDPAVAMWRDEERADGLVDSGTVVPYEAGR